MTESLPKKKNAVGHKFTLVLASLPKPIMKPTRYARKTIPQLEGNTLTLPGCFEINLAPYDIPRA